MRLVHFALAACALAQAGLPHIALAEGATIAAPTPGIANYDPQLSAKEAVMANWELAASGIRAGQIVGRQVADLAEQGGAYEKVRHQAAFALKTMLQRYNAARWIYASGDVVPQLDGAVLRAVVAATEADCASSDCADERAALGAAFGTAAAELGAIAASARDSVTARGSNADSVLMTEQLTIIADYLESGDWATRLELTEFGRDGEEVAARIVGAVALWRNVEPYVGLTNPEIDGAINDASRELLRTVVRRARRAEVLAPGGEELAALKEAADALAAEFRRAAALFAA